MRGYRFYVCRCGEEIEVSSSCDIEQQICKQCAMEGCFEPAEGVEWACPECQAVGKYQDIPRNSGVDICPDCRSPINDVEE